MTVGATATTYIMIDNTGAIQTSTSAWNANYARLGVVVSSGGTITAITIHKIDAIGGELSVFDSDGNLSPGIDNWTRVCRVN